MSNAIKLFMAGIKKRKMSGEKELLRDRGCAQSIAGISIQRQPHVAEIFMRRFANDWSFAKCW